MARSILASVHISSIYSTSQTYNVPIDTSRRDVPIAEVDQDVLLEHASFSSVFSSDSTGTIFLRVIHGGLVLEIIPVSIGRRIRFSFPAPIIPSPAILLHQLSELRIFVVTESGSLFTLTFPLSEAENIAVFDVTPPTPTWCKEYLITSPADELEGPVYIKDIDCILVALNKGRFLRLDCGLDYSIWQESVHRIKTSWASYLVSDSEESQIISFASYPPPTDSVIIFSLSRDRTLRAWSHGTCVASYTIRSIMRSSSSPAPRAETPAADTKAPLLDPEPRTLIRILHASEDDIADDNLRILVFIPNPASPESGGWFHLFRISPNRTVSKDLYYIRSIACSPRTAGGELRDFMVHHSTLYALWDQNGQPVVEATPFDPDVLEETEEGEIWHAAIYSSQIELTPDHLDELLLRSGGASLIDTFMTAILRPGFFSQFTIETALQQYTDSLLSLPGAQPWPLKQSYITLSEHIAAVVGCTVNVTVDPRTGVAQRANYWNALKRDWEGFVARCREIERSGRWPLSLGLAQDGTVLVLERERAGCVATSDQPLEVLSVLKIDDMPCDYPILKIGDSLRRKLSNAETHARETQFETMVSQERGYTYAETLEHCILSLEEPRHDLTQTVLGQLDGIRDLAVDLERILDVITSTNPEIKLEDPELDDSNPVQVMSTASQWSRGVTTAYVLASIEARYELCLTLVLLLFHIDHRRQELSPTLLSRIFATFRNVIISRFLAWQPAGDPDGTQPTTPTDQDMVILRGLQNMAVSPQHPAPRAGDAQFSPTYSLIHRLIEEGVSTAGESLPEAAFAHFCNLSLLCSQDAAEVTNNEVSLCKWLFDLGFRDVALEVIGRLPRSPGISYVHGLILVQIGRTDDGASLLQRVGTGFGPGACLSREDGEALHHVLPKIGDESYTEYSYYRWIATMFERAGHAYESVRFYRLAIELANVDLDTSDLWRKVISGYTELDMFEDAYMALVTAPYESIKREAVSQLVQAMCEANAVDRLMSLNFVGLPNEVENALSFKVRNADPLSRPMYPQVLYAWYVFRGDFRNAAATMYQFARRLSSYMTSPEQFIALSEMQAQAYLVAMNALSLIDPKSAWISMPVTPDAVSQSHKRRKLSKHIPDDKYHLGCRDAEVVDLADLRYEYTLVHSRLELVKRQPDLLAASQHFLSGPQIVSAYAQAGSYDYAMSAARSLDVDMTELFERLTVQCLRLTRRGEAALQDDTAEWLHSDRVAAWPGTVAERGWRYLRTALERHDTAETEHAYRKAAAEKILELDRARALPSWLVDFFMAHQPEYLIRTCLRFDLVADAVEHCLTLVRKANAAAPSSRAAASTYLPYGLIDAVVASAERSKDLTPDAHNLLAALRTEVTARVKRMQKWSTVQA
ncbi:hypothetical protein K439DRAFT_1399027 [Ramaria rubella]|nr:hypothetical protein K439DRAFT_1399027 [Ramaria rubella]